ncbi:uroporphyrinogen-III C-methyltransferase [uncultured Veillonella sp.]|uniref:uroporphyrinogen-III C-methyltransferase n=1 Tax=uncultured Veillonella sp. TaxID=159268 RepID=UPI0025DD8B01|nr:uroporphyrinogen-III C-methyltransferase [uncultured Veillonella sp.]MDY3973650.1 uroporphyrinogen-III C-methyltransferase [Veillonella caviae]
MAGIVYLVGAGPGDYKLITVKGRECIEKADVIVYDYLADEKLLKWAKPEAEIIYAGKQCKHHTFTQDEINAMLVKYGKAGKVVARLKGGDPLVFGRGGEEALALKEANIPFEFVPGVTSAISAPAYAGIPVTQRAVATSFAIVTGHEDPKKNESGIHWQGLATSVDTISFVMGVTNLPVISARLIEYGRPKDTPVAVIRWGTKANQETLVSTLETVADDVAKAKLKPPALVVVGEVVKYRDALRWFDNKPLFGKTVMVTRARAKASVLTERLEELGAQVIEAAAIKTQPLALDESTSETLLSAEPYKVVIFTSAEGVRYYFDALHGLGKDSRVLGTAKLCAIGTGTAKALADKGLLADIVPVDYKAESVVTAVSSYVKTGDKVLLIQPKKARAVIPEGLTALGVQVHTARLYETVLDESQAQIMQDALAKGEVDCITFTSSSTVTNTLGLLGAKGLELLSSVKIACIGPITAATCVEQGLEPDLISEVHTIPALVEGVQKLLTHDEPINI